MNRTLPFARRPLVPEDLQRRPRDYVSRAATAHFVARADPAHYSSPDDAAVKLFGRDDPAAMLVRAATSPATMTASGWASQLAVASVGTFLGTLAPDWASGRLI